MLRIFDRAVIPKVLPDLFRDRHLVVNETRNIVLIHARRTRPVVNHLIPQPVQLERGVFVKDDAVEVVDPQRRGLQRAADRQRRETRVLLAPAQSLLVNRELDLVVVDQRDGAVVVITDIPSTDISDSHSRLHPGGPPLPKPPRQRQGRKQQIYQSKTALPRHALLLTPADR